MKNNNEKIGRSVESLLKSINEMINTDAVIGNPIINGEDVIIPVTKVTYGFINGGGEYGKISIFKNGNDLPYSVGNGAVVSMKPYGFLVKKDGVFSLLSAEKDSFEKIIDTVSISIEKILNRGDKK